MKPTLDLVVPEAKAKEHDGPYIDIAYLGTYAKNFTSKAILTNEPEPADIIGISCNSVYHIDLYKATIQKALKLTDKVIVVGLIPTKAPETFSKFPETILTKEYLKKPYDTYLENGTLQPVDRSLLAKFYDEKIASIITSRGCPFNCPFCPKMVQDNNVLLMKPKDIVKDLKVLTNDYNIYNVTVHDDNFPLNKWRLKSIIEYEDQWNVHPQLDIQTRFDYVTEDSIQYLKRLNISSLSLGAESINDEALSYLKSGITREMIEHVISLCIANDININISFMYGTPVDTLDNLIEMYYFIGDFCQDSHIMTQIFCALPLPGTEFEVIERKLGYDPSLNWKQKSTTYPKLIQMHNNVPQNFYETFITKLRLLVKESNKNCKWNIEGNVT